MGGTNAGDVARRGVALVVAAALVGMVFAALPAGGAAEFSKKKALKLFYTKGAADAAFLDQAEADAAFLDQAEGDAAFLDQAEGDARYLRQGNIVVSQNEWTLNTEEGNADVTENNGTFFVEAIAPSFISVSHHLVTPFALGLRRYALASVAVCYRLVSGGGSSDKITATEVREVSPSVSMARVSETVDHTSTTGECYTLSSTPSLTPVEGASYTLSVLYEADDAADSLRLHGVTTTWVPIGAAAA